MGNNLPNFSSTSEIADWVIQKIQNGTKTVSKFIYEFPSHTKDFFLRRLEDKLDPTILLMEDNLVKVGRTVDSVTELITAEHFVPYFMFDSIMMGLHAAKIRSYLCQGYSQYSILVQNHARALSANGVSFFFRAGRLFFSPAPSWANVTSVILTAGSRGFSADAFAFDKAWEYMLQNGLLSPEYVLQLPRHLAIKYESNFNILPPLKILKGGFIRQVPAFSSDKFCFGLLIRTGVLTPRKTILITKPLLSPISNAVEPVTSGLLSMAYLAAKKAPGIL